MTNEAPSILIVDDESAVRESLRMWFEKDGYDAGCAADGLEGLKKLSERSWDIVLLDVKMPGMNGIELLHRIREIDSNIVCIMITAYASVETAVDALKAGALDYVVKPVDPDDLTRIVAHALEIRERTRAVTDPGLEDLEPEQELIGQSPQIQRVRELIDSVAPTDSSVLILGESGTGKEIVARLIHSLSPRRFCPLVPVHCGALPESLLESELFGHEKGSFTGAQQRHRGKLEIANGGTLLLDEIGTIDPRTQVDLLRAIESKQFTRVGGSEQISVDFRVIAATNQNLEQLVQEGKFREDFYYRINVFQIVIPPLRERRGDILPCARHFLRHYTELTGKNVMGISQDAAHLLTNHSWRGNIRELKNAMERAVVVCAGSELTTRDLPLHLVDTTPKASGESLDDIDRAHIEHVLQREDWNISRSAKILGIDRATLYNRIKKYGLTK